MSSINRFLLTCSIIALATSCSETDDNSWVNDEGHSFAKLSVEDFVWEEETRTSAVITPEGLQFSWCDNDTISIFPDQGSQVWFVANASDNAVTTATFDGGAWKLKKNHFFCAFYPFDYSNRYANSIKTDYSGQYQHGNNNINDACQKDYIYAPMTLATNDTTVFDFHHLGAFLLLELTMPDAGTYTSVSLFSPKPIFPIKQEIDLSGQEPVVHDKQLGTSISVSLQDMKTLTNGEKLTVALFLPPMDLTDTPIYLKAKNAKGKQFISQETIPFSEIKRGKAYRRAAVMQEETVPDIKLLAIGNSFSINELTYTPFLLKELLPEANITLGILHIGSSSLKTHWNSVKNKAKDYVYLEYPNQTKKPPYIWKRSIQKIALDILGNYDWDYITLQQVSFDAPNYETYQPYLDSLLNYLAENKPGITPIWTLTHAYAEGFSSEKYPHYCITDDMYYNIVDAALSVINNTTIESTIPYGTAVQNARKTRLTEYGGGDKDFKQLTYEGQHLQAGLPCLVASYASTQAILDLYGIKRSIMDCQFTVNADFKTGLIGNFYPPIEQGTVQDIAPDDYYIAKICAMNAIFNPYNITIE